MAQRRTLKITLIVLLSAILLMSAWDLSNAERGPHDANWARIQHNGFIVIGVDPTIPPFGQFGATGEITGFDPMLAQELGRRLKLQVYLTPLTFDGLYDSLLLGTVDVVVASLRPDPLRLDVLRYTTPYFDAGHVLVSQQGFSDLDQIAGILAVEYASEGDLAVRELTSLEIQRYFTADEALAAVEAGEAETALVDNISARLYLVQHPAIKMSPVTLVPDPYVIAVRRSDWRLHRAIEFILSDLRQDGTLDRMLISWLGDLQTAP